MLCAGRLHAAASLRHTVHRRHSRACFNPPAAYPFGRTNAGTYCWSIREAQPSGELDSLYTDWELVGHTLFRLPAWYALYNFAAHICGSLGIWIWAALALNHFVLSPPDDPLPKAVQQQQSMTLQLFKNGLQVRLRGTTVCLSTNGLRYVQQGGIVRTPDNCGSVVDVRRNLEGLLFSEQDGDWWLVRDVQALNSGQKLWYRLSPA